jgi:hypothetical protein
LFVGEKVRVKLQDGRVIVHEVLPGQTLSYIAEKYKVSIDSLVAENQMNAGLLGKDQVTGEYFRLNPMMTQPGGVQPLLQPQPQIQPAAVTATNGPALPDKAVLERIRDRVDQLASLPNTPFKEKEADKALLTKAINTPGDLTADERNRIRRFELFEQNRPVLVTV